MSVRRSTRLLNLKTNEQATSEKAGKNNDEGTDEDCRTSPSDSGDEEYVPKAGKASSSEEDETPVKQAKLNDGSSDSSEEQFELDSLTVDLSEGASSGDDSATAVPRSCDAKVHKTVEASVASTSKFRRKNFLAAVQRNLNNAASGARSLSRVVESTHARFTKKEVAVDDSPSTSEPAAPGEELRDEIAAMLHENELGGHHPQRKRAAVGRRGNAAPSTSSAEPSVPVRKGRRYEEVRKKDQPKGTKRKPAPKEPRMAVDDSTSGSDWEEVSQDAPGIPANGVVITLQPQLLKQKKAGFDAAAHLKRELNRVRREIRVATHKVHLLCLLAHGLRLEKVLTNRTLQATALSLLSPEFLAYSGRAVTFIDVDRFVKMYCRHFSCKLGCAGATGKLVDDLTAALVNRLAQCARDYALMFLVILRCLSIEARLCLSLYPIPLHEKESGSQGSENDNKPLGKKKAPKATKGLKKTPLQEVEQVSSDEEEQQSHGNSSSVTKKRVRRVAKKPKKVERLEARQEPPGKTGAGEVSQIRQPLLYVLGIQDGCVRELTAKYCSGWLPKRSRVRENWWQQSLEPFRPAPSERDLLEDKQLESRLFRQPMPSAIAEFKGHPVYVLKRHLLKYEALYPSDAPPLGFVRGEPVYARECVHTLRSRESWLREARMVRVREEPYKRVKGRAKKDLLASSLLVVSDSIRLLFGPLLGANASWSCLAFGRRSLTCRPLAFGGKVPRNEWGNVELFKSCMLPVGTVHLKAPALGRVAAKLNIDCVPAVVGFEGHGRGVHPVFDGWVVCEEFADTLMMAWQEEQVNISDRQEEASSLRRLRAPWLFGEPPGLFLTAVWPLRRVSIARSSFE
ncbi:hypothetical protein HPB47_002950 [Ixodes persulcatus]|uniref:Uncharacterized protein n=1 Tax=Ixodes persulcatus TaxID=34615 RepID=A0AC60PJU4_IXOPE|nr:hypothetical protein HPB47_002950 [Ixodes persulcatus]